MRQASRARRAAQVAALTVGPEYNAPFVRLYKIFILQLREVVPPNTHLPAAYDAGGDEEQAFVQNLALFFPGFCGVGAARARRAPHACRRLYKCKRPLHGRTHV